MWAGVSSRGQPFGDANTTTPYKITIYTPTLPFQFGIYMESRKLGVFGRNLEGSQSLFYCYFDKIDIRENETMMFN